MMEKDIKINDIVKLLDGEDLPDFIEGYPSCFKQYVGKLAKVVDVIHSNITEQDGVEVYLLAEGKKKKYSWDLRCVERISKFREKDIVSFSKDMPHKDYSLYRVLNVWTDMVGKNVLCRIREVNNELARGIVVKQDDLVGQEVKEDNNLEPIRITTETEDIKDDIKIYRDENKTIAEEISTGRKGIAYCHPDDDFNIYIGAKIALERLTSIQVGDRVVIAKYNSSAYLINVEWVEKNVKDKILAYSYAVNEFPPLGVTYEVIVIAKKQHSDTMLAYIRDTITGRCYLMNLDENLVLEDNYSGDL